MKFFLDNWMLISVALSSGALLMWPLIKDSTGGTLNASGAVQLMNQHKAVVIDVCEAAEFAAGHVGGSKHIALGELEKKLPETVKNKELPLIFVCQSGGRSQRAVSVAKKLGYTRVQSLNGGLGSWKNANLPLEKT